MKILFLSRWFPYPPDNGSKIRIFNLIKYLSSGHEVDLVSFTSETIAEERLAAMRRYCRCVDVALHKPFQPNRLKALLGFLSRRPRSVVDSHSVEMQRLVEQARRRRSFDVVIASQIDTTPYAMALPRTPKIFEEVELTMPYERFSRERHPLKRLRKWLTWWKSSRYVADRLRIFDGCTVVSERERELLLRVSLGYRPVGVIPNGVDIAYYAAHFGLPEADTLIYSGALTYGANFNAMNFFLREVLPLIQAKRPNVKLSITGKLDGVPIHHLPRNDGVILTGYLDDVRPAVAQSWACVVPLRAGGGTRLKILEAMALGTPVVSTSKGAEGLEATHGDDILIADTPAEFADAVLRLLDDKALRARLVTNGRRLMEERYSWETSAQKLEQLLHQVIEQRRGVE